MAKKTAAVTEPEIHESPMDYSQHQSSYRLFLSVLKWSVILTAISVVLLYFIIQP
jgi:hypothetical protein